MKDPFCAGRRGWGVLKFKQYFCRHDFKVIARHNASSQSLWQCNKCEVYCIQHWGEGTNYKSKTPHIVGWVYISK